MGHERPLKEALLLEIMEDEHTACFDRSYHSDKTWEREFAGTDRMTAFIEAMEHFNSMPISEILNYFGDRYNYVFEQYNAMDMVEEHFSK